MKKILKKHMNAFLAALAILFLGIVVGYFVWGVGYLMAALNQANNSQPSNSQASGFDLKGAASLDYRGVQVPSGTGQ